jgi:hypothetical protein
MMTTTTMASPSKMRRLDRGPSSTPSSDPLRRRVGDEVWAEVPPVAKAAVPPPLAKKVVSMPQDDSGSDNEYNSSDDLGNDDVDGVGNDNDYGKYKAMHIPFRMTPSWIMWFK